MKKLLHWLLEHSVPSLIRLACFMALGGLFLLCVSVIWPKPLMVVIAMPGGHVFGAAAFVCYLLAVILDYRRLHEEALKRPSLVDDVKVTKAS